VDKEVWAEMQRQLDAMNLKVQKGVMQDATFITAAIALIPMLGAAFAYGELTAMLPGGGMISDYTMLGKSARGSFWGSFAGYFIGSSFMYAIGLVSSLYAGTPDPIAVMTSLSLGLSALLVVVLSTVTTTFLDVYSAVMSTLNLTSKISKKNLILIFGALGILLAMYFPMEHYENFLYMIGSLFAPVFSVVIADYFIYKDNRSGDLFNLSGLAAAAVGVASYYIIIGQDLLIGATLPSMAVTMAVYALFRFINKVFVLKGEEKYAQ
jgi:putative hydroxymethylpyrimidine transporter CytX